ncbi:ABC transporter B family member 20-like [Zingiber officinale]|uniref:ABC transporter B family member 20-like n=1 Tax=Zingiber officinale TaxID=94328 RepID=UPI001C4D20D3|nr:ABC transporter B family member 20-like [Zingiber officinale]
MEHLHEICKCLKTLVDFLLCHCDSLPKHDPKPWDPPFDSSQPKLDPPLAVAVAVFLFYLLLLSRLATTMSRRKKIREPKVENVTIGPTIREGEQHVIDLSGMETLVRITASIMNMFDGNKIGFLVVVLNAIRLDFGWNKLLVYAISYIRTLYAFTNDTLAKYSNATSLQATLRFLISNGKANGGEIITALFVVILSSLGLNQAAINFYSFEQGRIAAYRLFEMISSSNSSLNQDGKILILSGFYQNVPARKTVAFVGRNDSRKSNIIPLIECFYDLTLGEVLLDGENIKHLKLECLSIKDNIAYGRSATSDQIEEAAKTVHAHDFITSLEMGYETQVDRTGLTLTEEKKIKISIARAVLSNPSILLLDEVTSGLDFEAEKIVQEALDILMICYIYKKVKRSISETTLERMSNLLGSLPIISQNEELKELQNVVTNFDGYQPVGYCRNNAGSACPTNIAQIPKKCLCFN